MSATVLSPSTRHVAASGVPVTALVWLGFSILLTAMWAAGHTPHGDVDDLLKAREIRLLIGSGDIFDRTIPGILQPQPFVSHWPWIVDMPYALVALALRPVLGDAGALSAAFFWVPLLLLAPTLMCLRGIIGRLGFERPDSAFLVGTLPLLGIVGEFQPGRIDYHNLQMLLLALSVWLILSPGRWTALANGVVTALAIAIGLELALFFLIVMAIHAIEFVIGDSRAGKRLRAYGAGLAIAACGLFFAITAPADYATALCDRYSSPLALALIAAGASFVIVSVAAVRAHPVARLTGLALCAAGSASALAYLFPHCLAGPYGGLPDYVRESWLAPRLQERSLFSRPDFVLSSDMVYKGIAIIGALASIVAAASLSWRDRAWTIACIFAVLATAHAILYFRYLRYMPMFAGPGLAFALAAALPDTLGRRLAGRVPHGGIGRLAAVLPGALVVAALVAFHLVARQAMPKPDAVDVAASCDLKALEAHRWPAHARVLSPPLVGMYLGEAVEVVAVPFHPAAQGIEHAYRFFDPATRNPRAVFVAAGATHVAVCALPGDRVERIEAAFPFTAALIGGAPPAWLSECHDTPPGLLRIYRIAASEGASAECPAPSRSP